MWLSSLWQNLEQLIKQASAIYKVVITFLCSCISSIFIYEYYCRAREFSCTCRYIYKKRTWTKCLLSFGPPMHEAHINKHKSKNMQILSVVSAYGKTASLEIDIHVHLSCMTLPKSSHNYKKRMVWELSLTFFAPFSVIWSIVMVANEFAYVFLFVWCFLFFSCADTWMFPSNWLITAQNRKTQNSVSPTATSIDENFITKNNVTWTTNWRVCNFETWYYKTWVTTT